MTDSFWMVMLASITAAVVAGTGIFTVSRYESWARRHATYFRSFAAGILIAIAFTHIFPRAAAMNQTTSVFFLAGFLGIYLINHIITFYVDRETGRGDEAEGIITALGLGFHSFIDGVIYAVTFNVSIFTGILASVGMVLHEFPEGVMTFVLVQEGAFGRRRALLYTVIAVSLTTPLGTLLAYPLVRAIDRTTLGALLGMAGGVLAYVGATHLLPEVEEEGTVATVLSLAAGVLMAFIVRWFSPD